MLVASEISLYHLHYQMNDFILNTSARNMKLMITSNYQTYLPVVRCVASPRSCQEAQKLQHHLVAFEFPVLRERSVEPFTSPIISINNVSKCHRHSRIILAYYTLSCTAYTRVLITVAVAITHSTLPTSTTRVLITVALAITQSSQLVHSIDIRLCSEITNSIFHTTS